MFLGCNVHVEGLGGNDIACMAERGNEKVGGPWSSDGSYPRTQPHHQKIPRCYCALSWKTLQNDHCRKHRELPTLSSLSLLVYTPSIILVFLHPFALGRLVTLHGPLTAKLVVLSCLITPSHTTRFLQQAEIIPDALKHTSARVYVPGGRKSRGKKNEEGTEPKELGDTLVQVQVFGG